jgi:hypothetical protein
MSKKTQLTLTHPIAIFKITEQILMEVRCFYIIFQFTPTHLIVYSQAILRNRGEEHYIFKVLQLT